MRSDYDLSAHQDKTHYYNCGLCGKIYYDSILRACPERDGRKVCAYCCRLCRRSYRDGSTWGCRAAGKRKGREA